VPDEIPVPILSEMPDPPPFLLPVAVDEWHRTGTALIRIGVLCELDLPTFAAFCQSYARWVQAEGLLAKYAAADPDEGGLTSRGSHGQVMAQPLVRISRQAAKQMMDFAVQLGLTITCRSRLASSTPVRRKFAGLLA
jgi:P27 family predicted phage terminase small subunit